MPPKPVPNPVHVPSNVDIPMEDGTSSAPNKRKRRDKRERHGDKIRRYLENHGKIPLTFRKSDGRAIGDYASTFMTELGVVVKNFAPIQVLGWKNVTEEQKMPLFDRLSAIFDIDLGIGPESVKEETDTHMGNKYRNLRYKMHTYYIGLLDLPFEERVRHVPEEFCDTEADWEYMCKLFESERFKKRSTTNATNRSKLPYNHCAGSKPFLQHFYDGTDGSIKKDRITVFNKTHYSTKKKAWVGEKAERVYDEMVRLQEEYRQTPSELDDGGDGHTLDGIEIADKVCDQVLGVHSKYIRGLGIGPKPLRSTTRSTTSSRRTNAALQEELQSTNKKMRIMEAQQKMILHILEGISPGAAAAIQSLTQQHPCSSTPSHPMSDS